MGGRGPRGHLSPRAMKQRAPEQAGAAAVGAAPSNAVTGQSSSRYTIRAPGILAPSFLGIRTVARMRARHTRGVRTAHTNS